uniref:hypothetical protein n=1 Tax=Hassallia byssoidea TaxID=482630 RepID=UPI0019119FFC|nr:hypothetical protein [Hassalia byssoidea]
MTSNKTVMMLRYYSQVRVLALIGLTKPEHPAHDLFEAIKDTIAGVSWGCADVFGAAEDAVKSGFDLIKDNSVPGTTGLPSLRKLIADGYHVLTF